MMRARTVPSTLVLLGFLAACGGGRSGTGISAGTGGTDALDFTDRLQDAPAPTTAFLSGNVSEVRTPIDANEEVTAAAADPTAPVTNPSLQLPISGPTRTAGVDAIRVRIDRAQTSTDGEGYFRLEEDFFGPLLLSFERPTDGIQASMPLDVPRRGTVLLTDIRVDDSTGQAIAQRQEVRFEGVMTAKDCSADTIFVASRFDPSRRPYSVLLGNSWVGDPQGNRLSCGDLSDGDQLNVQGLVRQEDGAIDDGIIEREGR